MSRFNEHGLTPQQEIFACKVASGSSNVEAYLAAYKVRKGRTDKSLAEMASKVAANAKVASRIRAIQAAAAEVSILKAADILTETRRLALSSVAAFFREDGKLKLPHELDPDAAACVASFEISQDGSIKFRLWDKNSACDRAAKILGLYEKDNKQKTDPLQALLDSLGGNVIGPKPTNGGEAARHAASDHGQATSASSEFGAKVLGPGTGDDG